MKSKIGQYFLTGLRAFVVSIVTMLIMIFPVWVTRFLWNLEMPGLMVVSGLVGLFIIFLYFVVWGWLANKFWRWK